MNKNVINFFKRNPNAVACHLVLDQTFDNPTEALRFKRNIGARMVTVTTNDEFEKWKASQTVTGSKDEDVSKN